ncbi:MAG: tRNA1(Val) (adenine(37)-N6)-methyltransferase [Selenomonadales bacterium]|nr:tRNA1(Val) (adenine(37)-N6)-methyltransferase [Selenomonadales bacterium]
MHDLLNEQEETLEDIKMDGIHLIQKKKGFRYGMDAIILSQFAHVTDKTRAIDLGTGTGIISLLVAKRGARKVTALEQNPAMADLAARNVRLNKMEDVMNVVCGDVCDIRSDFAAESADLVVSNPPYRVVDTGKIAALDDVARARHEITASLADFVRAAHYLVKYRGRFAMIHLPERMVEILGLLHDMNLEPKRLRMVYPNRKLPPSMFMVEAVKGAKPGLQVMPPLILMEEDGTYSEEILSYHNMTKEEGTP